MPTLTAQLAMVREYVNGLLDGLGLDAYLFEIEPHDDKWEVKVECAMEEGWTNVSFMLTGDTLEASSNNEQLKQQLVDELSQNLCACKRKNG